MRIRVSFAMVVGLLFCTLATLELPELLNLTDNTSNDYSLTVFQHRDGGVIRNQTPRLAAGNISADARDDEWQIVEVSFSDSVRTLPAALHMLCVLRT